MSNRLAGVGLLPGGETTMIEPAQSPPAVARPYLARLLAWLRCGGWRSLLLGAFGALSGGTYAHFIG